MLQLVQLQELPPLWSWGSLWNPAWCICYSRVLLECSCRGMNYWYFCSGLLFTQEFVMLPQVVLGMRSRVTSRVVFNTLSLAWLWHWFSLFRARAAKLTKPQSKQLFPNKRQSWGERSWYGRARRRHRDVCAFSGRHHRDDEKVSRNFWVFFALTSVSGISRGCPCCHHA